ncbi:MAG: succinate dehydrogenase, partial [Chloroflexota bacterium]
GGQNVAALRKELATAMHQHAGLVRDATGLNQASQTIERVADAYKTAGVTSHNQDYNFGYLHYLELGYLLDAAQAIVASAAARRESRGVHYRTDFPNADPTQGAQHHLVTLASGSPIVTQRPVEMSRWQPSSN